MSIRFRQLIACELHANLFKVQNDFGNIFPYTGNRRKFMKDAVDLNIFIGAVFSIFNSAIYSDQHHYDELETNKLI